MTIRPQRTLYIPIKFYEKIKTSSRTSSYRYISLLAEDSEIRGLLHQEILSYFSPFHFHFSLISHSKLIWRSKYEIFVISKEIIFTDIEIKNSMFLLRKKFISQNMKILILLKPIKQVLLYP